MTLPLLRIGIGTAFIALPLMVHGCKQRDVLDGAGHEPKEPKLVEKDQKVWPPRVWWKKRLKPEIAEAMILKEYEGVLESSKQQGAVIPNEVEVVNRMRAGDFGAKWKEFRAELREGRTLWWFRSPEEDWDALGGREGFLIEENMVVVDTYLLSSN